MTHYLVERAPGDGTSGWRVVAVTGNLRRAYLTRFAKPEHAQEEADRLTMRDSGIRAGVVNGFGQRMGR